MDPFTILGALKTIADVVVSIKNFARSVKEARGDLRDILAQLKLLRGILTRLKAECESDGASDPALKPMLDTVSASVQNCEPSVRKIETVLKKYQRGGLIEPAIWAVSGKQDAQDLRRDLDTRTTTLQLSLNTVQFCLTRTIRTDVSLLVQDSSQIKEQLAAILKTIQGLQPNAPGTEEQIQNGIKSISDITGFQVQPVKPQEPHQNPTALDADDDSDDYTLSDDESAVETAPSGSHLSEQVDINPDEPVASPSPAVSRPASSSGNGAGTSGGESAPSELKLLRSFDSIEHCAVGPKCLVATTTERQVQILELPNLNELKVLDLQGREPTYLTFSSNFMSLLIVCRDSLTIWSAADGAYENELPGHKPAPSRSRAAMSHDQQLIATTGRKGSIEIWQKKNGSFSRALATELEGRVEKLQFSSRGDLLGIFCSHYKTGFLFNKRFYRIEVWSTSELRMLRSIALGQSQVTGQQNVKFLSEGHDFSAVSLADATQELTFWDLNSGSQGRTVKAWQAYKLRALPRSLPELNMSANHRLVVLDRLTRNDKRQRVDVWDLESKRLVGKISDTSGLVRLSGSSLDSKVKVVCTWRDNDSLEVWEIVS